MAEQAALSGMWVVCEAREAYSPVKNAKANALILGQSGQM